MAIREDDFVQMTHPKVEAAPVRVPRKSFDRHWKAKGWEEHKPADVPTDQPLSSLKRDELDALAVERGLTPSDYPNKADLVAALES
jgi:hypothetical protein